MFATGLQSTPTMSHHTPSRIYANIISVWHFQIPLWTTSKLSNKCRRGAMYLQPSVIGLPGKDLSEAEQTFDDHPMIQSIGVCGFSLKDGMGNSQSIPKRPQSCAASVFWMFRCASWKMWDADGCRENYGNFNGENMGKHGKTMINHDYSLDFGVPLVPPDTLDKYINTMSLNPTEEFVFPTSETLIHCLGSHECRRSKVSKGSWP